MREKTKKLLKILIDFHEANGRVKWKTTRYLIKTHNLSQDNARYLMRMYEREGIAVLDKKQKPPERPKLIKQPAVEMCKRVLELLKEDPNISANQGAALLNCSTHTFWTHKNRLMNPQRLTNEHKIQLGLIPGTLPNKKDKKNQASGVPKYQEGNIKQEALEPEMILDLDHGSKSMSKSCTSARHCLLCFMRVDGKLKCNKPVWRGSRTRGYKDDPSIPIVTYSSVTNECGDDGEGELGENLNVIFALKNIFGLTSSDLLKFMKASNGKDPKKWYDLCESCDVILKEAIAIQHQVLQLSKELEKCKKMIHEKIRESTRSQIRVVGNADSLVVTKLIRESISDSGHSRVLTGIEGDEAVSVSVKMEPEENDFSFELDLPTFENDMEPAGNDGDNLGEGDHEDGVDLLNIPKQAKLAVCETCGEEMGPSKLAMHALRVHDIIMEGFTIFKCQKEGCKYTTLYKTSFRKHVQQVHTPYAKRKHVCKICGKKFAITAGLREHQIIHRTENPRPYQCEICGSSFAAYATLYNHRRIVHEKNPAYVNRNKCKKKDPWKSSLKVKARKESRVSGGKGDMPDASKTTTTTVTNDAPAAVPVPATENPENTCRSPSPPQAYDTTDAPATTTISLALMQMYSDLSHVPVPE